MALCEDDKREIREEIWKAMNKYFTEKDLTPAQIIKDHQFVATLRESSDTIRRASLWTLFGTLITAMLALIWCAVTGKF